MQAAVLGLGGCVPRKEGPDTPHKAQQMGLLSQRVACKRMWLFDWLVVACRARQGPTRCCRRSGWLVSTEGLGRCWWLLAAAGCAPRKACPDTPLHPQRPAAQRGLAVAGGCWQLVVARRARRGHSCHCSRRGWLVCGGSCAAAVQQLWRRKHAPRLRQGRSCRCRCIPCSTSESTGARWHLRLCVPGNTGPDSPV